MLNADNEYKRGKERYIINLKISFKMLYTFQKSRSKEKQ